MPRYRLLGFRFKVLRLISELGPVDEITLAEAFYHRYQEPVRVRLLTRTLRDLDREGWIRFLADPASGASTPVFTTTRTGERALLPHSKRFMEVLRRLLRR